MLWLPFLPFVGGGWTGLAVITAVHTGTVFFTGVFNPVFATLRLERAPRDALSRILTTWTVATNAARAGCTLVWGMLAAAFGPRPALALGAGLLLPACLWLPRPGRLLR